MQESAGRSRFLGPAGGGRTAQRLAPSELRRLARGLAAFAGELADLATGAERAWRLVADSDAYEAWVIGWPAGGALELHDHGGSRGVVSVVAGSLLETSVAHFGDRLALRTRTVSAATSPLSIGVGRIHDVTNLGPGPALSVHVYSPRLTSMTFFELTHDELRAHRTEYLGPSEPASGWRAS
jgi:predicted metal-dependent enzyme (double-stranded beta helix superfamily)